METGGGAPGGGQQRLQSLGEDKAGRVLTQKHRCDQVPRNLAFTLHAEDKPVSLPQPVCWLVSVNSIQTRVIHLCHGICNSQCSLNQCHKYMRRGENQEEKEGEEGRKVKKQKKRGRERRREGRIEKEEYLFMGVFNETKLSPMDHEMSHVHPALQPHPLT